MERIALERNMFQPCCTNQFEWQDTKHVKRLSVLIWTEGGMKLRTFFPVQTKCLYYEVLRLPIIQRQYLVCKVYLRATRKEEDLCAQATCNT